MGTGLSWIEMHNWPPVDVRGNVHTHTVLAGGQAGMPPSTAPIIARKLLTLPPTFRGSF
jgi:hypothetical protein